MEEAEELAPERRRHERTGHSWPAGGRAASYGIQEAPRSWRIAKETGFPFGLQIVRQSAGTLILAHGDAFSHF